MKVAKSSARVAAAAVPGLYLLGLVAVSGCGGDKGAVVNGTPKHVAHTRALNAKDPLADSTAAVPANRAPGPVQVRYTLGGKPQVGEALEVRVMLLADTGVQHLGARFQGGEGLTLVDGESSVTVEKPAEGQPLVHTLHVIPKRDGIFTLDTVVSFDSGGQSLDRTFAIPLIAGDGLPDGRGEQSATAAAASSGAVTHKPH